MRFFAIAAALVAAVSAGSYDASSCAVVTVTETVTAGHVPSAPASLGATAPAPYPTTSALAYPQAPSSPAGTGAGATPQPASGTGAPHPSGTGSYTATPPLFSGAANAMNVPAGIAGIVGLAAYFL